MRRVSIDNLKTGMKLAKPIYARSGRILLDKGIELKEGYIKRLIDFDITHVYIHDERMGNIEVSEIVNDETRLEAARIVHQVMDNIRLGMVLDVGKVKDTVREIMSQVLDNKGTLAQLTEIRVTGEMHFHHAVNVAIYALLTGIAIKYNSIELLNLGTGAILHDIGKSRVPTRILNQQGPLAEPEIEEMKKHTQYGFDILRKQGDLPLLSAHVAFQHHEHFDGSGYPRQMKGADIHEFARITAIANTYDLLVGGLQGTRLLPYQTVEYIVAHAGRTFDPDFARVFSTNIAVYPLGSLVRLNNGEKGFVIRIPKNYPTRPVIRVIINANGKEYGANHPELDLMKELTFFIEEVLEE